MDISLVPYRPAYAELFIRWRSQPLTIRHNPLKPFRDEDIVKALEGNGNDLSDLEEYDTYQWFVECDGNIVGNVSIKNINHMMMSAEIGYGFDEAFHGKGIATRAVELLMNKVFAETDLRKIFAYVHDKNIASCRVLEKVGFKKEGLLREHFIINGVPENEVFYGLLREEWRPR